MKNPPMEAQAFAKWLNNEGACRESLKWQRVKADTIRTLIPYPLKQPTAEML